MRAAALSLILVAFGAQAEECGPHRAQGLLPFTGTWQTQEGWITKFDRGAVGYQRPDMKKIALLHIVAAGKVEEPDDVSLDCRTLDSAGIAKLLAEQEDYAAMMKGGPDYANGHAAVVGLTALLTHPSYHLVVVTGYESITYYIMAGKDDLVSIWNGEAQLSVENLKRKY